MDRSENHGAEKEIGTQLWHVLQELGFEHLNHLKNEIHEKAPFPGALVLIDESTFRSRAGVDSVLFSAIDVCTHLQVARPYFLSSRAAALDFLDHTLGTFPFRLQEIRTKSNPLFCSIGDPLFKHPFTRKSEERGVLHSVSQDNMSEGVLRVMLTYLYPCRNSLVEESEAQDVSSLLHRFVHFHNHFRSLATLGGMTPIRMLRSFKEFEHHISFDPLSRPYGSR